MMMIAPNNSQNISNNTMNNNMNMHLAPIGATCIICYETQRSLPLRHFACTHLVHPTCLVHLPVPFCCPICPKWNSENNTFSTDSCFQDMWRTLSSEERSEVFDPSHVILTPCCASPMTLKQGASEGFTCRACHAPFWYSWCVKKLYSMNVGIPLRHCAACSKCVDWQTIHCPSCQCCVLPGKIKNTLIFYHINHHVFLVDGSHCPTCGPPSDALISSVWCPPHDVPMHYARPISTQYSTPSSPYLATSPTALSYPTTSPYLTDSTSSYLTASTPPYLANAASYAVALSPYAASAANPYPPTMNPGSSYTPTASYMHESIEDTAELPECQCQ